jgi:hypothetical protein
MSTPEPPKPDPSVLAAQRAQHQLELERIAKLKEEMLKKRKGEMSGLGMRSLLTGGGAGYGRNFFA